ncbi:MAG: phosphopantetheine-binding protein [Bdellovibrionia bacterium]
MSREIIVQGVIACVAESLALDTSKIGPKSKVIAELGAESLDFMDIIFRLDAKFGVSLQKEDFDLLARVGLKREDAVQNEFLTASAKDRLVAWLPGIPVNAELKPKDLAQFVSVESIALVVEERLIKSNRDALAPQLG